MSNALLNIFIRVISRRLDAGEDFDEIITSYPKLSEEDIAIIKERLGVKYNLPE